MRLASLRFTFWLSTVLLGIASFAQAGVPSPGNSTLPGCIHASPDASLPTVFLVRDLANNPINHALVVLNFYDCPAFEPCPQPGNPPDDYFYDIPTRTIRMFTDGFGQAVFYLRAGGGCQVYPIAVYADGVFLGYRRAASTDQNGDHFVNAADVAILQSKVGGSDLTGDLDCDGVVNSYDLSIQDGSLGSECLTLTPSRPSSWGRVKTIYR